MLVLCDSWSCWSTLGEVKLSDGEGVRAAAPSQCIFINCPQKKLSSWGQLTLKLRISKSSIKRFSQWAIAFWNELGTNSNPVIFHWNVILFQSFWESEPIVGWVSENRFDGVQTPSSSNTPPLAGLEWTQAKALDITLDRFADSTGPFFLCRANRSNLQYSICI